MDKGGNQAAKIIFGIDGGFSGAIVAMIESKKGLQILDIVRLTTVDKEGGGYIKKKLNAYDIIKKVQQLPKPDIIGLEQPNPINYNSRGTLAAFFQGLGIIEGIVSQYEIEIHYVDPVKWKKKYNLIGKTKRDSISTAGAIFPGMGKTLVKDADVCEAALIGHYTYHYLQIP